MTQGCQIRDKERNCKKKNNDLGPNWNNIKILLKPWTQHLTDASFRHSSFPLHHSCYTLWYCHFCGARRFAVKYKSWRTQLVLQFSNWRREFTGVNVLIFFYEKIIFPDNWENFGRKFVIVWYKKSVDIQLTSLLWGWKNEQRGRTRRSKIQATGQSGHSGGWIRRQNLSGSDFRQ